MQTANSQPIDGDVDSLSPDGSDDDAATPGRVTPSAGGAAPGAVSKTDGASDADPLGNLSLIRDIEVKLSMEIGHTRVSIDRLLSLIPGSVVELDRMADEPLDVLVNGTLVARGEAVVVGDRFGIRLIEVVSPAARLGKLA